ncbi:bifunctional DedA family/phosphatase PAP2 family protein [Conexibacter sp. CPCC 206217]|uniref:bifunctional DedA family/phosphatase PAP2 family protein n=1 Tax=Conexibacter sp. CPCC 206217 TaxID=3064574 RepID=UPI00271B5B90|nr:bifunctional DedA family/phosphatase PAP2 family protein [Conexibacter sp. CPCC 206217]MDO8209318.1 bifunctional DedA family/phosphatase PAP2 family protein [Conexibacter sp. CPCC 206217]
MKPIWFAVAVAVAAFAWWRRRRLEPPLLIGLLIVAAGSAVYGTGLVELPDLEKVLTDLGRALGTWTYLLVGALCFLESGAGIGLLVPGETAIIVGGVVAGQGEINIILLIAIAWTTAVAGDLTSFFIGRRLGRQFLVKHGPRFKIDEPKIEHVEAFYAKHGGKAVFLGRFVGLVRAVSPFVAGSSGMPLRRFLPYDVLAAGIMCTAFSLVGYLFWHSLDRVLKIARQGTLALATVIVLVVAIVVVVRWLRVEGNREKLDAWIDAQEPKPAIGPAIRFLRALGRRLAGPARFLWQRLTPGQLGLELTSLLAVAAVGSFVFFGYLIVLDPITTHTPGDLRGARWSTDLQSAWLTDLAKILTHLGSLPVAGGALALVTIVLLTRREWLEGLALLAGGVLTYAGVHITKAATDRPRPTDALIDAAGSAFPSGHAAYSVFWVAIAIALRRAFPGLAARAAVLTVGIALAVVVGLTRIYLRAHWFSDVAGGWGLAAMCFALTGMVALIVSYFSGGDAARERNEGGAGGGASGQGGAGAGAPAPAGLSPR